MALFCARYLTSVPFAIGLSESEIKKHAITGYYGFQDYAAAFWWKHAHRVTDTTTDIDSNLYNSTAQAVARVMEAYSNSSNSLSESGGYPTDAMQYRFKELAEDPRKWEKNFRIEFRTRAIRNVIEMLLSEEDNSETHGSILTLYGVVRYKCPKPWCQSFCTGFKRREDRDQHLLEHDRPFRCSVEGCYWNEIGFPSESGLNRHIERLHSTQSSIRFPTHRPSKSEPKSIFSAASTGDLAELKARVLDGISINATSTGRGSQTPLYLAAKNGHIHICQYLLEQGADVNFRGNRGYGRTALHAAALADDVELTHLLLSQPKVAPGLLDKDIFTAAGTAAKNGCNNALSAFISRGLTSEPSQDSMNRTCLNIAWDVGNLITAELLLNDTSLDLNKDNPYVPYSIPPLHRAASTGLVKMVKLLLSSGRVDVNKVDRYGRQALHHACENGHDSIVELLLPVIDNHDARDDKGTTPFQYAIKKKHAVVVKMLLESGKIDANIKDNFGRTPLLLAAEGGEEAIVKLLLEHGKIDANLKDDLRWTPLLLAAAEKHIAVVKLLEESGKVDAGLGENSV